MKIMSSNFNIPFVQMVIWILLLVGLVVPFCSSLALRDNDYKSPTPPTALFPPPQPHLPPFYPETPILNKPPPIPNPPQASFDYFTLAETWPTTFCKFNNCPHYQPPPAYFTIHGLWPEKYNVTKPPEKCNTNKTLNWKKLKTSVSMSDFDNYWPVLTKARDNDNVSFWKYQWNKHGTCSSMDPKDYFNLAFQLYKKNNLKTILQQMGNIVPGSQQVLSKDIFNAIKAATNHDPQIICQKDWKFHSYLEQVRLCLDKSGAYIDCAAPGNKCSKKMYFP